MPQGTAIPAMQWSLSPNVGTLVNGVYTAPASVSGDTQVTITATSLWNTLISATATVLILQPVTPVSISLSAGSSSLTVGQSVRLTASVTGTSNTAISWVLTPNIGTISNGVYSAPNSVSAAQNILVTATSQADPTKSASVPLLVKPAPTLPAPTVSVTLSPANASLDASQSMTFTAAVSGTTNTAVSWSINPSVGTITNGVYQAPATVGSQQTVTITATSAADSTKTASASVALIPVSITVAPNSVSLGPGKSATFTAAVTGTSNTAVNWSLNPATGTIVNGVYTAPTTVAAAQQVMITAISAADSAKSASATVSLTPSSSSSGSAPSAGSNGASSSPVTLPVEVMGSAGTTATVSVTVPSGSNLSAPLTLWMQIHGLKYDSEASVQVNKSAWLPISTGNVTLAGLAAAYGGIGGGFHTLTMTMKLPAGVVVAGTNTITFQFNGTDGVTSGYRVLQFNIQSAGDNLIPSSQFVQDDPNTWQPPSSAAADITAGQNLWHTGALTIPGPFGPVPIQAHCADCHSEDGRDLKYFNYSNNSIETRAVFHGLTAVQGAQIASFIRSLNVPNPGRPWNPPYQPGPGLDSQPVANWSAGAGLSAVLDSDADMQPYLLPGGSAAGWSATAYLDVRELPIPLQLPDWNSWLPTVNPIDAFGTSFTSSGLNTFYQKLHGELQANSATSYANALGDFSSWFGTSYSFLPPLEGASANWNANNFRAEIYSVMQWIMVKDWELNQEFGLESMPQVKFGAKADARGWIGNMAFNTSPLIQHIPAGTGLGNGGVVVHEYLGYIWYHTQLILNDGQGQEMGSNPIDFSYTIGQTKTVSIYAGDAPAISLQLMWLVKALQEFTLNGFGPQVSPGEGGFAPTAPAAYTLADAGWMSDWSATSPATLVSFITDYLPPWFAEISSFSNQDYYQGVDGGGRPWASPTENPQADDITTFGGEVWRMLPRMRYLGVDQTVLQPIYTWAEQLWPAGNWAANVAATCSGLGHCTSD